jgi:hypothetical protein
MNLLNRPTIIKPSIKELEQAALLRGSMSFMLTTAINIEDVPKILKNAAANYKGNAKHDRRKLQEVTDASYIYPELWAFAASLFEETAKILEEEIKITREKPSTIKRRRPKLD